MTSSMFTGEEKMTERLAVSACAGVAQWLSSMAYQGLNVGTISILGTQVNYALGSGLIVFGASLVNSYIQDVLAPMIQDNFTGNIESPVLVIGEVVGTGALTALAVSMMDRGGFTNRGLLYIGLQGGLSQLAGESIAVRVKLPFLM